MSWTPEQCREKADQAEALALTVAYEKDRLRLREEARTWREEAFRMERRAEVWSEPAPPSAVGAMLNWFKRKAP